MSKKIVLNFGGGHIAEIGESELDTTSACNRAKVTLGNGEILFGRVLGTLHIWTVREILDLEKCESCYVSEQSCRYKSNRDVLVMIPDQPDGGDSIVLIMQFSKSMIEVL